MSCLPSFSFSQSIPSAVRPYNDPPVSTQGEREPNTPIMTSTAIDNFDTPYDKLSQVSVSHRRVDSFEWVITQSAPNTPPTMNSTQQKSYSPAPTRLISSAPLPAPNEHWSIGAQPCEAKERRGFFDWWTSPSLASGKGYTKISKEEENDQPASVCRPIEGPSRPLLHGTHTNTESFTRFKEPPFDTNNHQLRPSQELNALGIVFPCTPPSSPPDSIFQKSYRPQSSPNVSPRVSAPRLSKRVSFSPIIDEIGLKSSSGIEPSGPQTSLWGSYLPSSFLVARPPISRTTSLPVSKGKTLLRPILRRSTSLCQPVPESRLSTEMTCLRFKRGVEDAGGTVVTALPIPAQRLSMEASCTDSRRTVGQNSDDTDRAFASLLQAAQKHGRQRCDFLLSNSSCGIDEHCN